MKMLAPYLISGDKVILFDGVCNLCNGWAKFIIKQDNMAVFKLASVQSKQGKAILEFYNLPTETFETMLVVEESFVFYKSDAFFRVIKRLPYRFRFLMIFSVIPRPIRDWLYDRVASNRYKLFGKKTECDLPSTEQLNRFLK